MSYMVVETTLVDGARLFSLQATKDIQNGAMSVAKEKLSFKMKLMRICS